MINGVKKIEVVVAHSERATLRVGDVFLKIDADQAAGYGGDVEVNVIRAYWSMRAGDNCQRVRGEWSV